MVSASLIQALLARALFPLMLGFSLFLFLRGHHHPGGGFAAGLTAAFPYLYYTFAFDVQRARRLLKAAPEHLLGGGLLILYSTAVWPLAMGQPLLEARWADVRLDLGPFELQPGTALLFDLGVYLVSLGGSLVILFAIRGDVREHGED